MLPEDQPPQGIVSVTWKGIHGGNFMNVELQFEVNEGREGIPKREYPSLGRKVAPSPFKRECKS